MEECSRRCEDCKRCNYISYSLHFRDCSWYHSCQMDALYSSPQNRTTGVPAFRSLMVRAVAPEQESLQDEATAKNAARAEAKARAEKAFAATSARAWSSTLRSAGVPESSWGARCRSLGADPLKPRPASTTSPAAQLHQRRLTLPMATKRWLSRSSARTSPRAVVAGLTRHLANRALRASLLSQRPSHSSRSFISPRRQARRLPTTWQLVSGYLLEPRSRDETRSASVPAIHHAFG